MITTTGSTLQNYIDWLKEELERKDYGEVSIRFTITKGQISDVRKESIVHEHFVLQPGEKKVVVLHRKGV